MNNPYQAPTTNLQRPRQRGLPGVANVARWILIYLAIGPSLLGLDALVGFLPELPVIVHLRQVRLPWQLLFLSSGLVAAAMAYALSRHLRWVLWLSLPFGLLYLAARYLVFVGYPSGGTFLYVALCLALPILLYRDCLQEHD